MDLYTVSFLIIFVVVGIGLYFYYLYEKGARLRYIEKGFCPKCRRDTIEIVDRKSHGCSGTVEMRIECRECEYKDTFTIEGGGCSGGRCSL